jgi:tetratricopeptide (TPR) repeat protein
MKRQKGKPDTAPVKNTPAKNAPVKKVAEVPASSGRANAYFVLFFFLLAFILYGNTMLNKFAVDDEFVTNNAQVKKGFRAIPEIFTTYYITQQGNIGTTASDYRPVVKLTFALEHQFWGTKPGVSHGINILIYFALSTLLFFTLKRILKNYNILFPVVITVLFMAHPVHTEVVASLKNRDEMLAFIAGLGALWYILDYAETRKVRYLLIAMIIFIAGFLSKTSILPFLALYPLVLHFFTDLKPKKFIPVFLVIFSALLLAYFLPRLFLPEVARSQNYIENPLYFEKNLWLRLGTAFMSLLFYLRILIYPHPLLFYYGYNTIPVTNLANLWVLLSILLYAAFFIYAIMHFRKKQFLSFAILWYLIAIAMYSNILVPVVGIVGERFVFTASLGFVMALVFLVFKVFKADPRSLTLEFDSRLKILAVIILISIPFTALTISRNRDWRNLFDLYRTDIKHLVEKSAKANIQYAGYLMNTVYRDENFLRYGSVNQFKQQIIISHFRQALRIYPNNYQTLNDLGTVYLYINRNPDSAVVFLRKAVELRPNLQPAWVNLGMAYRQQGKFQDAIACYEHILKNNPNQIKAVFALADVYNDMGDFGRAVKMNEEIMQAYPDLDMPYINIGNYNILQGDTAVAVRYWEKAASINPTSELCMQLSNLYKIRGDVERTDYYYKLGQEAIRQNR